MKRWLPKRWLLVISLCVALAAMAVFLLADGGGNDQAVKLKPEMDHEAGAAPIFQQNDSRWAESPMGQTQYKMAGSGCLVSCIAASLKAQGADTDPGRLNELFGAHHVYNEDGEVLWSRIADAVPGVRVDVPKAVDVQRLERELARGRYPIVKVKYLGSGYQHWVLIVGAAAGEYLCMDPLSAQGGFVPLSRHGGAVYRVRYVWVE